MEKKSYFIETEAVNLPGAQGELQVWQAIKLAFKDRECIAYWRYPVFSNLGKKRKELDILIIDRILGVIAIEVKSIKIEQITSISGHLWTFKDFYEPFANPYQQSESGLYALLSRFDQYAALFRKVRGRAIVALPKIEKQAWVNQGFHQALCSPQVILMDDLKEILSFIEKITPLTSGEVLSEAQWKTMLSLLNAGDFHLKETLTEPILQKYAPAVQLQKKSEVIAYMNQFFHEADLAQSVIGLEIPPGVQRIRGIAGSGKTVLLCQKAAIMHLKHPDWKIAFVFFTRTLYDQVIATLDRWIRHYSNGAEGYTHQQSNLMVFHAWGSKQQEGFYRYLCQQHGQHAITVTDTEYKQPNEGLADGINRLLHQTKINPIFDAILIDEGQDLVVDPPALKYENKQSIYWLAYEALKSVDPSEPKQKRLIWAYDEAQRLDADAIPSGKEIFGEELSNLLRGVHKGQIQKNHVMKKCYRTPGPILVAAHALGMGFLRKEGPLSGISTQSEWENIGYLVESGNFRDRNSLIRLNRPKENSPHPISSYWQAPLITFNAYTTRQDEINALAQNIKQDLQDHGLKASRNLLVIILSNDHPIELENQYALGLMAQGITIYVATATQLNQINPRYPNQDPNHFWFEGGVTLSRVARAKGNEAEMVYVVGLDQVAKDEANTALRNQLFVALSRSKGWVSLSGIGHYDLYDEVKSVLNAGYTFEFINKPAKDISHEEQLSLF